MAEYIFAYHGGKAPESPEEGAKVMQAWMSWIEKSGAAMTNPGKPAGMSKTVSSGGVADNGGANPISGYAVVNVGSMDEALAIAKGCPILDDGGSVEVAELMEM